MLTVLTWYWRQPGGRAKYEASHVNIWAAMVRRHLSMPHRIACVTDLPDGIDPSIEIIAPPRDFEDWRIPTWGEHRPQCLRRLAMFAPDAAKKFGEHFVSMDLDCLASGPLDPLFCNGEDFKIFAGTAADRSYNGSMVMLRAGARPQVYQRLTLKGAIEAGRKFTGSDQAWIAHCLGSKEATWSSQDGVEWWGNRHRPAPPGTRLVFFPGPEKPWDIDHPFVRKHYRGNDKRKCLVLGYGSSIWEDAERALKNAKFDLVIASPEAAEHWPGPIYAVAKSDRHADEIVFINGFEDVVFCGRSEEVAA